jgi:hypothetical protein
MKKLFVGLFALAFCVVARTQQVALTDVLGPDNLFHDAVVGVSLKYPAGWEVLGGMRWGAHGEQNTFRLKPLWPSEAMPSIYYQPFPATEPRPLNYDVWFREGARLKEASRAQGASDYRNVPGSFVIKTVAGHPTCRYLAHYTTAGRPMAEYIVRVAGEKSYVMFFTMGPVADVEAVCDDIDRMAASVQVP